MVPDAVDIAGEGDGFERGAVHKSIVPDAADIAGEGDTYEPPAVRKSFDPDAVNIAGEGDTYELQAARKSTAPDPGDRVAFLALFNRVRNGDCAGCASSICQCDSTITIQLIDDSLIVGVGIAAPSSCCFLRCYLCRFGCLGCGRLAVRKGGHAAQRDCRRQHQRQQPHFLIVHSCFLLSIIVFCPWAKHKELALFSILSQSFLPHNPPPAKKTGPQSPVFSSRILGAASRSPGSGRRGRRRRSRWYPPRPARSQNRPRQRCSRSA